MFERILQGAVNVIEAHEPITAETVETLHELASTIIVDGQPMVVLDLAAVPLINSIGLETILDLKDDFNRRGGNLKLAAPNPLVSDILKITQTANQFEVYERVSEAVGSFVR